MLEKVKSAFSIVHSIFDSNASRNNYVFAWSASYVNLCKRSYKHVKLIPFVSHCKVQVKNSITTRDHSQQIYTNDIWTSAKSMRSGLLPMLQEKSINHDLETDAAVRLKLNHFVSERLCSSFSHRAFCKTLFKICSTCQIQIQR